MVVELLSGSVVAHGGAGVGVAGGDLDVAQVDAGVEHVVTKVWRRQTPATAASWCSRRAAAWQSSRTLRRLCRIGPSARWSMARSRAQPTAGGNGTRTVLSPLPWTRRARWPWCSVRLAMLALVASKMRKRSRPSIATRRSRSGSGIPGGEDRFETTGARAERQQTRREQGPADMFGRWVRQGAPSSTALQQTPQTTYKRRPTMEGWKANLLHPSQVQLRSQPLGVHRMQTKLAEPGQDDVKIRFDMRGICPWIWAGMRPPPRREDQRGYLPTHHNRYPRDAAEREAPSLMPAGRQKRHPTIRAAANEDA